ncbi:MAG: hypothetical protein V2A78_09690 [bacterium]
MATREQIEKNLGWELGRPFSWAELEEMVGEDSWRRRSKTT